MDCGQIKGFLLQHDACELPPFKAAWVAQHLAGCPACAAVAKAVAPAPVAVAAEHAWPGPGPRDRVGPVVRLLAGACAVVLAAAAVLTIYRLEMQVRPRTLTRLAPALAAGAAPPPPLPEPTPAPPSVPAPQRREDITLRVESIQAGPEETRVRVRFEGSNLNPPADWDNWVTVLAPDRHPVESTVHTTVVDPAFMLVDVILRTPGPGPFHLRFSAVAQRLAAHWYLLLPAPPARAEQTENLLSGRPEGTKLLKYGIEGDLLLAEVGLPLPTGVHAAPDLMLRDGSGALFAPVYVRRESPRPGFEVLTLAYPLPRQVELPFMLVANATVHLQVGPWLLNVES